MRMKYISFTIILFMMIVPTTRGSAQPPDTMWTYQYSSSANDEASAIIATADGGFVVGGQGKAPDSTASALLIRLDISGHQRWARGYPIGNPGITAITNLPDGGFAATGGGCADFGQLSVMKCDSDGHEQWFHCFHYLYLTAGVSIAATRRQWFGCIVLRFLYSFPPILVLFV